MNLGFSEDDEAVREAFRQILSSSSSREGLHAVTSGGACRDEALWGRLAESGWLGAAIPESRDGVGLEPAALCVLAEEAGRALTAIPYVASSCGFAAGLTLCGNVEAAGGTATGIADGSVTGLLLHAHDWAGRPALDTASTTITGTTTPVRGGASATTAMTLVGSGGAARIVVFALPEATEQPASDAALDPMHPCARFACSGIPATPVAEGAEANRLWKRLRAMQATFVAFEQLGGAEATLYAARDYSLERYAFGRAIGSFQSLKHMMADMLAATELARANCHYAAAALDADDDVLDEAATVAHLTASDAYALCARQSIQIHGGIGVTWEADPHLHYRRAHALRNALGPPAQWKERLVEGLLARHRTHHQTEAAR